MGVNAIMRFEPVTKLTDKQITDAAWRLSGAFYREPFFFYDDARALEKDGQYIKVNLSGRYYGIDYERGSLHTLIAIAEWIEYNFNGASVFYGGDSDESYSLFDKAAREKLKEHFFKVGHLPYVGFTLEHEKGKVKPDCPKCSKPMIDCGGGGADTFWFCYGCDNKAITRAGSTKQLWFKEHEGNFFDKHKELDTL